jgi:hypothetical protein
MGYGKDTLGQRLEATTRGHFENPGSVLFGKCACTANDLNKRGHMYRSNHMLHARPKHLSSESSHRHFVSAHARARQKPNDCCRGLYAQVAPFMLWCSENPQTF